MVRLVATSIVVCVLALASGCSSPTPAPSAAKLPDDFSLSVTVLPGSGMEPAWYIIDPDGTLRAAVGERQPQSTRPAAVRTLSRAQVRQVWEVATKGGLTDHNSHTQRVSPASASSPQAAALVDVSAMGRRTTSAIDQDQAATGVQPVVTLLRELAWADK